jgi:rubrerythrin
MKDEDRAIRMLKVALEMEDRGKIFYDEAVAKCTSDVGRDIFRMLRDDELVHMDRIRTIYTSLEGGKGWTTEWKSLQFDHKDLGQLFRDMAQKHGKNIKADTSDMEAIEVGLDFEQKSIRFYEDQLKGAEQAAEREFIERMVGEERMHYFTLKDMKLYLTDPSAWFIEAERHGLDGA